MIDDRDMCFSVLSFCETCAVCGRAHPGGPADQCLDWAAAREASGLEAELERYLASNEAQFFSWLADR